MSVLKYFKNIPRSSSHRATGPKCNFFFFKFATKSLEKKKGACRPPSGDRVLSPVGGATGPPLFFFSRDFVANLKKKKLHFGPVALWEGDRGIFLKYFKTDIYF